MNVSIKKLCDLYQSDKDGSLNRDLLLDVASRFDQVAQTIPGFHDENDRDMGKDAYNFHCGYMNAIRDNDMSRLMVEIDFLIHGIHTMDRDVVGVYVKGTDRSLLDHIANWSGKGNLYQSYQSRT